MEFKRKVFLGACCVALLLAAVRMKARTAEDAGKEIEAFNRRYVELHEKMDTAGILALWAEDGVDLMPGDEAMIGRKKISAWVEDIVAKMPGYKVMKQEMEFKWRWYCIALRTVSGRFSKRCGTRRRNRNRLEKK